MEFLVQSHWFLSAKIHQDADFIVTLDQARYCKAIVNRFLEKAGAKKKPRFHSTILPADLFPVKRTALRIKRQPKLCSKNKESTLLHVLEPCFTCHTPDQT